MNVATVPRRENEKWQWWDRYYKFWIDRHRDGIANNKRIRIRVALDEPIRQTLFRPDVSKFA
ncbi:hypothetical protein SAMN06298226_2602 [Nitrosovibrio sp. Nv4]|nr:hypothetical protein SAMN06298226_2602 [Nitrosovibrio sp. Nv4]